MATDTTSEPASLNRKRLSLIISLVIVVAFMLPAGIGAASQSVWFTLMFVVGLLLVSSATRTLTLNEMASFLALGAASLCLAVLLTKLMVLGFGVTRGTASRPFVVPIIEEVAKLVPVLVILWLGRKSRSLTFGVTDFMLMGALCGAGFQLVEDAYILSKTSLDHIAWLPLAVVEADRGVAGHAIWSSSAALTVGLAFFLRLPAMWRIVVAGSGWTIVVLDHIANNYAVHTSTRSLVRQSMLLVTMNGYLLVWLFPVLVLAAIAFDARLVQRSIGNFRKMVWLLPAAVVGVEHTTKWNRLLWTRRVAFFLGHSTRTLGQPRPHNA